MVSASSVSDVRLLCVFLHTSSILCYVPDESRAGVISSQLHGGELWWCRDGGLRQCRDGRGKAQSEDLEDGLHGEDDTRQSITTMGRPVLSLGVMKRSIEKNQFEDKIRGLGKVSGHRDFDQPGD